MSKPDGQDTRALVDDPAWVLDHYREAKDLLGTLQYYKLPDDLREPVEDFLNATFLDTCTTLGPDCACNRPTAPMPDGTNPREPQLQACSKNNQTLEMETNDA